MLGGFSHALSAIVDETSQLSEHVRDDGHIN
jgi:hypothetical protein